MKRALKRACLHHLHETFGLRAYRPGQKAAAHALLSGQDLLCILPTGAGKSLCWQLPSVVHGGLTVVVSPLIALMQDQVAHLKARGISAVTLNSLMSQEERRLAMAQVASGHTGIVFIAPERLMHPSFLQLCQRRTPWLVVVDEAHCVVQWGQEFRPAYAQIRSFIRSLARRPVLCAMTATADKQMQQAIARMLSLRRTRRVILPIVRENLVYDVRTTLDRTADILHLCQTDAGKTVIFCRTRERTEQVAGLLCRNGISAAYYHAGLDRNERETVQQRFQSGEITALAATTAFGMGVDVPQIRRVVHDHLPDSLIDYVQQSGRAGRDGQRAECILLLTPNDVIRKGRHLHHAWRSAALHPIRRVRLAQKEWQPFRQLLQAVLQAECIPAAIAGAFGKKAARCGLCSACRKGPLTSAIPDLMRSEQSRTVAFFLRWQRDAIAKARRVAPCDVLSESGLAFAAQRLILPEDAPLAGLPLERLLAHVRQGAMHENGADRIS